MDSSISRRKLLERGVQISVGGAVVATATSAVAADKVCADPKAMDSGQKSIRQSLNYTEMSPDQTKTCSACGFFTMGTDGCGQCMIFTGPANPKGHCDSWSQKS
jgi:hypothetical protein